MKNIKRLRQTKPRQKILTRKTLLIEISKYYSYGFGNSKSFERVIDFKLNIGSNILL